MRTNLTVFPIPKDKTCTLYIPEQSSSHNPWLHYTEENWYPWQLCESQDH